MCLEECHAVRIWTWITEITKSHTVSTFSIACVFLFAHKHGSEEWWTYNPMCPDFFEYSNYLWIEPSINTVCQIIYLQYAWNNAMQLEFWHESSKSPNHISTRFFFVANIQWRRTMMMQPRVWQVWLLYIVLVVWYYASSFLCMQNMRWMYHLS